AVENLGALVEFEVLTPPNFAALRAALEQAIAESNPYEVIHFDGHGVYDAHKSFGALVFEDPRDAAKLSQRRSTLVDAGEFAALMRDYRIPLVFLEACQSAQFEHDPTASVAAQLLDAGVTSVAAMTHSVLVETARRFTQAFYRSLAAGARVGDAMLAGQKTLAEDSYRIDIMGAGELHLQDWFVPVLYQEKQDPQLFDRVPDAKIQELGRAAAKLSLGALPEPPAHTFIGRSRELLALERLLLREWGDDQRRQYAVIVGAGGAGKTTIAVELAQWLARTQRFDRVAFASLEFTHDDRALLDSLGRQLCGVNYSVAEYKTLAEARLPVDRALRDQCVLLVVDNVETILTPNLLTPNERGLEVRELGVRGAEEIFALLQNLLAASPQTRLLLTSRETLPAPFDFGKQHLRLGALSQRDAVDLVSHVMTAAGHEPPAADPGETPEEVTALVEAVGRHARALVLIAREVASRGVRAVTRDLAGIMAALEARYPGQRENSLFASVELSLRRLTDEGRRMIKPLGAFHSGCNLWTLMTVLEIDESTASQFTNLLISVGLAQPDEYSYLHLDPALPPYLWGQMSAEEQVAARAGWGQAMRALVDFLYQQRFKDRLLCNRLTLLELPNLLAALDWAAATLSPEEVVDLAGSVEQLLANLNRPRALALAVAARQRAAKKLGEWGSANFEHQRLGIERTLAAGNLPASHEAAQKLLQRALAAGKSAYPSADYDIAFAHILLGRVLSMGGAATAALEPLNAAQVRFEALGATGNQSAARMASAAITEQADCLTAEGRLEDAATAYQAAMELDEKRGDIRDVAVGKIQLGTVRKDQRRY
ncbi:MAG: CHAT domain-containing protein, partial [Chloroflexi bacterium]|nr:CHAT domain-containing protein [Chloroflexota bacterium]